MLSRSLTALIESRRSLRDVGGDVGLGLRSKDTSSYEYESETCGRIVHRSLMRKDVRGALRCPKCRQPKQKQSDLLQRGDILPPSDGTSDMDAPGRMEDDEEDLLANAGSFWGRCASEPAPTCHSCAATLTKSAHRASKVATIPRRRHTINSYDVATIAGDDEDGIRQCSAAEAARTKWAPTTPTEPTKRLSSKLSAFSFSTATSQVTSSSSVSAASQVRRNSTGSIVPPQMKRALSMAQSPSEYRRIQRIIADEFAIAEADRVLLHSRPSAQ